LRPKEQAHLQSAGSVADRCANSQKSLDLANERDLTVTWALNLAFIPCLVRLQLGVIELAGKENIINRS
jgi:hypothetical protein